MFRRQPIVALLVLAFVAACGVPSASPSTAAPGTPRTSLPTPTTRACRPQPLPRHRRRRHRRSLRRRRARRSRHRALANTHHDDRPSVLPDAGWQRRRGVNEPTLVPVDRTVPKSPGTATAAMKALLAGPSAKERAARPADPDAHPRRLEAPGIEISRGLATVDLSAEFASLSTDDAWDMACSRSADVWPRSPTQ